jgi:D-beta-D-heptose 7-phosphate kinase/D-beta-D-heptose 1-phosphate adenosyltransferase
MQSSLIEIVQARFRASNSNKQSHALVIGDVMLDKYLIGDVERISPEAPVPVLHLKDERHCAGGAANVAANLVGLGLYCTLVGLVGSDAECEALETALSSQGIHASLLKVHGHSTIVKTRVVTKNQQMLRIDRERRFELTNNLLMELVARVDSIFEQNPNVIVLSDYAKGILSVGLCQHVIKKAKCLGIPVVVDPKGRDFTKYRGATTITPNRLEAIQACDLGVPDFGNTDIDSLILACERLCARLELDFFVLTRSEEGITLIEPGKESSHFPVHAKQVFDVSGAGDTVIATIAACLAGRVSHSDAMILANTAASVVVGKVGTAPILSKELLDVLQEENILGQAGKVCELDVLLQRIDKWRHQADRIVFTNGCFDLLHAGHVTYLESAKRRGDKLVVGLNTDRSVRDLKGPQRPVIHEQDRARVLAALECVDAVVLFDEDTLINLINTIRPDVLAKGSDYREYQVVGSHEVHEWGGEVALIPIMEGRSTSQIITKLSC